MAVLCIRCGRILLRLKNLLLDCGSTMHKMWQDITRTEESSIRLCSISLHHRMIHCMETGGMKKSTGRTG